MNQVTENFGGLQTIKFSELQAEFNSFKEKTGNPKYVAAFGKTFLDEKAEEYNLAFMAGEMIINNDFGVLHGGYCGIMEAVSRGADAAIAKDEAKNKYWNIGVPMKIFDRELARSSKVNLSPANDIIDRQRALIELCDACLVFPSGGFGTLTEAMMLFHMNQIARKFGNDPIRPLIFIGGNWKSIFSFIEEKLDMNKQQGADGITYFIETIDELRQVLEAMKNK